MTPEPAYTDTPVIARPRPMVDPDRLVRWHLHLRGAVQGVGYRPLCVRLAGLHGLTGWVRNGDDGLHIEVQGPHAAVEDFALAVVRQAPNLARVTGAEHRAVPPEPAARGFAILESHAGGATRTGLPADAGPCEDCVDDILTPGNRRHRYALTNCTNCGPRFTVTARLPYDRPHTSLAAFPMCADCESEYHDPQDRRFHAQPTACPVCGPRLRLLDPQGLELPGDPLREAARRLQAGEIVAVKGVGGYHLVADVHRPEALRRLRSHKQRASKPFAVMVPNVASARRWVDTAAFDDAAGVEALMANPSRPILLLPCRPGVAASHPEVAAGLDEWGLMLPASPLHLLLVHEALGAPADRNWRETPLPLCWVMTSANPGGEPLVIDEAEALERLLGLADALLVHDRPILGRCDDSVRRPMRRHASEGPAPLGENAALAPTASPSVAPFVRRARGHVPEPIELPGVPDNAPPVLALGGWMKSTVCLTRGRQAFLSPHIGDLSNAASCKALVEAVTRLQDFLGVQPQLIAHDLHPDFFSTRYALERSAEWGVPRLGVQHHHAHAAAVRAEHGLEAPSLALVLDGVGLGDDAQAWGGELLRLDGPGMQRLAHLPHLPLPGGDAAAREPWRMAAACLHLAGRADDIARRWADEPAAPALRELLARQLRCPPTSSAGRLFDAAAALLGLVRRNGHDGAGAMALEAAARRALGSAPLDVDARADGCAWSLDDTGRLHWTDAYAHLADVPPQGVDAAAAGFHATLAQALVAWVGFHARAQGLDGVALAGGCFINRLLRDGVMQGLQARGLKVLEAVQAPCGDGGLALGQAALALRHLQTDPAGRLPGTLASPPPVLGTPS